MQPNIKAISRIVSAVSDVKNTIYCDKKDVSSSLRHSSHLLCRHLSLPSSDHHHHSLMFKPTLGYTRTDSSPKTVNETTDKSFSFNQCRNSNTRDLNEKVTHPEPIPHIVLGTQNVESPDPQIVPSSFCNYSGFQEVSNNLMSGVPESQEHCNKNSITLHSHPNHYRLKPDTDTHNTCNINTIEKVKEQHTLKTHSSSRLESNVYISSVSNYDYYCARGNIGNGRKDPAVDRKTIIHLPEAPDVR